MQSRHRLARCQDTLHGTVSTISTSCHNIKVHTPLSVARATPDGQGPSGPRPGSGPEPGARRRATMKDASRLAKIFGPSRYPAFVPDESLVGQSNPPPNPGANQPGTERAPRPVSGTTRPPVGTKFTPPRPPGTAFSSPSRTPVDAGTLIQTAKHWRDLTPLLPPSGPAPPLPARLVKPLAEALMQLAQGAPPQDEAEVDTLRQTGERLAAVSRLHLGGGLSSTDMAAVVRAMLAAGAELPENWLLAAELGTASRLHAVARAHAQAVTPKDAASAKQRVLEETQDILQLVASFLAVNYTPRDSWLQQLITCTGISLQYVASAASKHLEDTAPGHSKSKGPLISVPDQVITSTGETLDMQDTSAIAPAPTPASRAQGWSSIPKLSTPAWAALASTLLMWKLPVGETWLQSYLDASYGALAASSAIVTEELGGAGAAQDSSGAVVPLVSRVLDVSIMADVATSLLIKGVRPSQDWLGMLEAASGAVFQRVSASAALGGTGGLTAHPASAVNIMLVLSECDFPARAAWVEGALAGVAADESVRPVGDHLATLLFEASRPGWELGSTAVRAATVLGGRAQQLWEEQAEVDRQRKSQGQRAETRSADGEEDVTGFSAQGLTFLLAGLSRLQALHLMPAKWLQAWGDQAVSRSQDFDIAAMVVSFQSASQAGVLLPARVIHVLGGQALETMHRAGAAATHGSVAQPSQEKGTEEAEAQGEKAERETAPLVHTAVEWHEFVDALAQQPVALPAPWLTMIQDLAAYHLSNTTPEQIIRSLQVLSLLPEAADPAFVRVIMNKYQEMGAMESPEGCVAMAAALVAVGADAAIMKEIEEAGIRVLPHVPDRQSASVWAEFLSALTAGGHVPGQGFWDGLAAATNKLNEVEIRDLCVMMLSYATLRMARLQDMSEVGLSWAQSLCLEACRRLPETYRPEDLSPLLGAMANMAVQWPAATLRDAEQAVTRQGTKLSASAVSASIILFINGPRPEPAKADTDTDAEDVLGVAAEVWTGPGPDWCVAAVRAIETQRDVAEPQDLVAFMTGVRQVPGLKDAPGCKQAVAAVMAAAGRRAAANGLRPSDVVAVLSAGSGVCEIGVKEGVGGATTAVSALLERALAMRELMSAAEICELFRSVRGLGVKPPPRWSATLLTRFQTQDPLAAGPEAVAALVSTLDSWNVVCADHIMATLCQCVTRMASACVQAGEVLKVGGTAETPVELVKEQLPSLVQQTLQVLQAICNLRRLMPEAQQAEVAQQCMQVWPDMSILLTSGHVPYALHDSLLYATARMTPPPTTTATTTKDGQIQAVLSPPSDGPAAVIAEAAVIATRKHMPNYEPAQLGMVFSTLASVQVALPSDWMSLYWEYSRPHLRTYTLELLVATVGGLSTISSLPWAVPPKVWEEALYERIEALAKQCGVTVSEMQKEEVYTLLRGLQNIGLRPSPHVLQLLLDAALSSQQTAAARLATAQAAATVPVANGRRGVSSARPQSMSGTEDHGSAPGQEESADKELVGSTRSTARRFGLNNGTGRNATLTSRGPLQGAAAAGAAAGGAVASPSSVQASIAAKAVGAAVAQQAFTLGQVMVQVVGGYGYVPDKSWLMTCQSLVAPALASPHLPVSQRAELDRMLKEVLAA